MKRCYSLAHPSDWLEIINVGCRKWKSKSMEGILCLVDFEFYCIWHMARQE
jgi:hypothetical protein